MHERAGAHRARLFRDIKVAVVEPPIANRRFRLRDGEHLRMRSGILQQLHLIPSSPDDPPVLHYHGADRHLFRFKGFLRETQRLLHEGLVDFGIGHRGYSFTSPEAIRTLPLVRLLLGILLLSWGALAASAQQQDRKLIDRLLKPDTNLQNSAQNKQFTVGGSTLGKQARTKAFYVAERPPEKKFWLSRLFATKKYETPSSRFGQQQANLTTRTQLAKVDVPYSTPAYSGVKTAPGTDKPIETSEFAGQRSFLVQGKSQKALSQQDRPMTIDQVRELLNKNK